MNSAQGGTCPEHSWPGSICWCCSGRIHPPLVKNCKDLLPWYTRGFRGPQKPTLHFKNDFEKYNFYVLFGFNNAYLWCSVLHSFTSAEWNSSDTLSALDPLSSMSKAVCTQDFPVMISPLSAAWNWTETASLTSQQSMMAPPRTLDYWGKRVVVPSPHLSLLQTRWQLCCPQTTPTPTEDFQLSIPVLPCQVLWSPTVSALHTWRGWWFFLWCDSSLRNIQKNWWSILRI